MSTRTFDYIPRHDERSRAHRIAGMRYLPTDLAVKSRYWTPGPVLDQGQEGACVGFGCTAEATASPMRVKANGLGSYAFIDNRVAFEVYTRAKQIDEWEGVDYDGTSVLAGMKVGRERGWWSGYRWAFNMTELRAALETGPVIIGVEWRELMYTAPDGLINVSGPVVGGHCLLVTGYSPNYRKAGPFYRLRNSWGTSYGRNGSAWITPPGLDRVLFQSGGEAAVPIGRAA